MPDSEIDQLVQDLGFVAWFPTSAKDNINIDKAVRTLVTRVLEEGSFTSPSTPSRSGVVKVIDDNKAPIAQPEDSSCFSCK